MILKKKVLIFLPKGNQNKFLDFDLEDWQITVVRNAAETREVLTQQEIYGGVCFLSLQTSVAVADFFKELHPYADMICWIALVEASEKNNESICNLIREQFDDFHTLPVDFDRLRIILGHAIGMAKLRLNHESGENSGFGEIVTAMGNSLHGNDLVSTKEQEIIGYSAATKRLLRDIQKVARTDATTLITGETGTGKELAARTLHLQSQRKAGPFIAVNCSALPTSLIQSELFGYEKGAFTGAGQRKLGYIEEAHGGTLFLDEIGDLPHELQINLLRFLQERTVERIGSTRKHAVDTRIIAATHVDLEKAMAEGRFRQDLYYRLNVLQLSIAPLCERREDIQLLAHTFLQRFRAQIPTRIIGFSKAAWEVINQYPWPGNVRELMNRIHRAVIMCEGRYLTLADLGLQDYQTVPSLPTLGEARADTERNLLRRALHECSYNVSSTAQALNISRRQLYRLLEKYGIMHVVNLKRA